MKKLFLFIGCNLLLFVSCFAQQANTAAVKPHLGRPSLFINGVPEAPVFYSLTHAFGGRWSWEEVAQRNLKIFCGSGTSLYQVDIYLEDIWYKDTDTLDMSKVQRQVRGVMDACPGARVVIRIHVNAPFWWNERNPDECTRYADGPVENREYGIPFNNEDGDVERALRASLASVKWRTEAGDKLKEFCERLYKTPEGNSVIGFHVSGGIYGEWHYWGFIPHDPDTGPAMTAYFRDWLRKKYKSDKNLQNSWRSKAFTLNTATVPGKEERIFTADSIFHDPEKEQRVIDYFIAQQQVVAEDIEYFCKIVKDTWRRPNIVGVFYGYFHMTFCRQATGGHLFIERILDSPYIDYLAAPQTYWGDSRRAGGSGNSRGIIESTLLHGKLWLDEMDNGGEQKNYKADLRASFEPSAEYASLIRRNSLLPLMRGIGLWYYDFGVRFGQGWWDRPLYQQQIAEEKRLFDSWIKKEQRSVADVLVVWSMESFYYVKNVWYPLCYDQLDAAAEELLRAGAATDHIYLFDLDTVNLDQYKAVVFMNTYKMSESERLLIRNKVAKNKRTLIFNYLPAYTDGTKLNISWVEKVTGMRMQKIVSSDTPSVVIKELNISYSFAAPVHPLYVFKDSGAETVGVLKPKHSTKEYPIIARKQHSDHTIIHALLPVHQPAFFRKLFSDAGCHIYNTQPDFTYANSNFVMLHTKNGGDKKIKLRNGKLINVAMPETATWLFNASTGEVILPTQKK